MYELNVSMKATTLVCHVMMVHVLFQTCVKVLGDILFYFFFNHTLDEWVGLNKGYVDMNTLKYIT